jgi:hypothetical protein
MTQLSAEAIDSIEDDDVADAITPETVFISTRVPSNGGNRVLSKTHIQVKNHNRLMKDLRRHPTQCVRQFAAGFNTDALHLVTIYNALLNAVAQWDRNGPPVLPTAVNFIGQEMVDADAMEAAADEEKQVAYIDLFNWMRAAGYKMRHPRSNASTGER